MLVAQAKKAAEEFTHSKIPDDIIDKVTQKISGLTRNIVLIGMPGCGKSSIGSELASKTGRELVDTDEWVINHTGKSIPAIFTEDGEETFRNLEKKALETLCKQSGSIIATGGGIVKCPENRNTIRQNSVVIFIDRDITELPVSGRPLSEKEGVGTLAKARLPIYEKWCDYKIKAGSIEETTEEILKKTHGGFNE